MILSAFKVPVLILALLSLSVGAQAKGAPTAGSPGCGDDAAKFEVKTDKAKHPPQSDSAKAHVYFIEDDTNFKSVPKPTTRAGLDGNWVGATHGNSYLYFSVDPGVHHLCASWQLSVVIGQGHKTAAAHFTAEAGGVYYFEVKNTFYQLEGGSTTDISLTPLDSDEGQLLAGSYAFSASKPKK